MPGAAIVRWEAREGVVLAVHGPFDGATAWSLRIEMEESPARAFIVDLTHAVDAFDFAASVLAWWARRWSRVKRVRFRPGTPEHARILAAHGLELVEGDAPVPAGFVPPVPAPGTGASA